MPIGPPNGMKPVPGGSFSMGADLSYSEEGPAGQATAAGFWIDEYAVTSAKFAQFVAATGYLTVAERPPDSAALLPLILPWDETFDIGADTGTPVDDKDYQVPFRFTGKIDKLTIAVEPPKLTPEYEKRLREAYEKAQDRR